MTERSGRLGLRLGAWLAISGLLLPLVVLFPIALLLPRAPRADEPAGDEFEVYRDPILQQMHALDQLAPFEDPAPLWDSRDLTLQSEMERSLTHIGLDKAVRSKRLAVVLVDISDLGSPRVAEVNGDVMMYAASLPKIAILLSTFELIAQGRLELDAENEALMKAMIRRSSNSASTELMHRVGKENIARVLLSPRYRLYDPARNGGLWVGKDYAKAGLWRRDPLHNLSHGATGMQVARFYYLLETGNLVTPEHSRKMKEILANTELEHKFARVLHMVNPGAAIFRKSGSWSTFHSDSVLVKRGSKGYIAVALSNDPEGSKWLQLIINELDALIFPRRASLPGPS